MWTTLTGSGGLPDPRFIAIAPKSYSAIASNTSFFRQTMYLGIEFESLVPVGSCRATFMMRSGCGYGSGCSRTASTTVKIAVLAPMPMASAASAIAVNPRFRRIVRRAYFRSAMTLSIRNVDEKRPVLFRGSEGRVGLGRVILHGLPGADAGRLRGPGILGHEVEEVAVPPDGFSPASS